jgi:hypothetical protein
MRSGCSLIALGCGPKAGALFSPTLWRCVVGPACLTANPFIDNKSAWIVPGRPTCGGLVNGRWRRAWSAFGGSPSTRLRCALKGDRRPRAAASGRPAWRSSYGCGSSRTAEGGGEVVEVV